MAKANNPPETEELINTAEQSDNKRKKEKKERIKGEGGGGVKAFIIIFIAAIIGLAVAVVGFNAFNIRDRYLMDTLRRVPIINNLLPPPEIELDGELAEAETEPVIDAAEYEARIAQLEREAADHLRQIDSMQSTIDSNQTEINRLREIERQHEDFRAEKREFDEMIARNDPGAYAAFYESIAPETAEELYPSLRSDADRQTEIDNYLAAISQIDANAAAKMLEELVPTDLDLVVEILKGLSNRRAGEIMGSMSAANAASIAKRWDPINY